jgi:hypothetical protein
MICLYNKQENGRWLEGRFEIRPFGHMYILNIPLLSSLESLYFGTAQKQSWLKLRTMDSRLLKMVTF